MAYGRNLSVLENTLKQRADARYDGEQSRRLWTQKRKKNKAEAVSEQIVRRLGCLATRDGDASFPINQK